MDIQKELISYTVSSGKRCAVISTETDVIVPDSKPDAEKILQTDADAVLNGFEVQNGRVLVYGTVKFNILYSSPENELKNVATEATFTDVLEVSGAEPGLPADVSLKLKKHECRILNGRKLSVKADIEVCAEVFKGEELDAVSQIEDAPVEAKTKSVCCIRKNAPDVQTFLVKEQAEIAGDLPSAFEILRAEAKISNKNLKVISNKIIVKADIDVSVLYAEEVSHSPCFLTVSLPFTEILEIDGICEEWLLLHDMNVLYTKCEVSEDGNGEMRILELETAIESRSSTAVPFKCEVLSDCYGVGVKAETVTGSAKLLKQTGEIRLQTGLKTQLRADETEKIAQVYNVCAKTLTEGIERGEKELYVKGKAFVKLMYITENESVGCLEAEVPFREILRNIPTECDEAEIIANVNGLSYTLNGENSVEVRGNLELSGILTQNETETFVTAVSLSEKENAEKTSSITVYFVQNGESLWDIAKRYETSVDLICEANGIKQTDSVSGKKLIVPKYKSK